MWKTTNFSFTTSINPTGLVCKAGVKPSAPFALASSETQYIKYPIEVIGQYK